MTVEPALAQAIRDKAFELEFERVGFCDAAPPEQTSLFERWLDAGMHASMIWMQRARRKRLDPRLVLEDARSMIVVALPYASPCLLYTSDAADERSSVDL